MNQEGKARLVWENPVHGHKWEYIVNEDGDTITAVCAYDATHTASVKLSAEDATYDGEEHKTAKLDTSDWAADDLEELEITYEGGAIEVGEVTASVTATNSDGSEVKVSVTYEIKATTTTSTTTTTTTTETTTTTTEPMTTSTTETTTITTKPTTTITTAKATTTTTKSTTTAPTTTATEKVTTTATKPTVTTNTTTELKSVVSGDINMNGQVTIIDVVLLNRAVAGVVTLNDQAFRNADCGNVDQILDYHDVNALMKYLVGIIDSLPENPA